MTRPPFFVHNLKFQRVALGQLIASLVIVAGVTLRLIHYFTAGSLWHDEACLALNIVHRDFLQLLKPLDYDQLAPVGYLWLEKVVTLTVGSSDLALRLPSLAASIAALIFLALLCKRVFGIWCAIVATAIIAVSPLWIYYAAELKPYSLDAALALWLMLSFEGLLRDGAGATEWRRLFAKAIVAVFFSESAIVILLCIGAALAVTRPRKDVPKTLILLASSAAIAAALYVAVYRAPANRLFLKRYWAPYELAVWLPDVKRRLVETGYNIFFRAFDSLSRYLHSAGVALLAAAGIYFSFVRVGFLWTAVLISPYMLLLAASAFGIYPIAPRSILFALFPLVILVALSIVSISEWAFSRHRDLCRTVLSTLVILFVVRGSWLAQSEFSKTFPRISQQAIAMYESQRNCDALYVFSSSLPVWYFYTEKTLAPDGPSNELVQQVVERNHERVFAFAGPIRRALQTFRQGCRPLILGELPPAESQVLPNYDWAAAEMQRIANTGADRVYIFGELFAPSALAALERQGAKCGAEVKTLLGESGKGYLGELVFKKGNSCR